MKRRRLREKILLSAQEQDKLMYIYRRFGPLMKYTASRILENRYDIDDAVQNALVTLANNIRKIDTDDNEKVKCLCMIAAKNRAIDIARLKCKDYVSLEETLCKFTFSDLPNTEQIIEEDEKRREIVEIINSLNHLYRDVCYLKYINELTDAEISAFLGLTVSAVKSRLFRGKKILREKLWEAGLHE